MTKDTSHPTPPSPKTVKNIKGQTSIVPRAKIDETYEDFCKYMNRFHLCKRDLDRLELSDDSLEMQYWLSAERAKTPLRTFLRGLENSVVDAKGAPLDTSPVEQEHESKSPEISATEHASPKMTAPQVVYRVPRSFVAAALASCVLCIVLSRSLFLPATEGVPPTVSIPPNSTKLDREAVAILMETERGRGILTHALRSDFADLVNGDAVSDHLNDEGSRRNVLKKKWEGQGS